MSLLKVVAERRGATVTEALVAVWAAGVLILGVGYALKDLIPAAQRADARLRAISAARAEIERAASGEWVCGAASSCTVQRGDLRITLSRRVTPAGTTLLSAEAVGRRGERVYMRGETYAPGW